MLGAAHQRDVCSACYNDISAALRSVMTMSGFEVFGVWQGHIWQEGFASGELTADLYDDVQPAMTAWASAGLKTYIYSSGSRQAQRDLFGHTKAGDLRGLLSGFFDTSSGAKACHCSSKLLHLAKEHLSRKSLTSCHQCICNECAYSCYTWQITHYCYIMACCFYETSVAAV